MIKSLVTNLRKQNDQIPIIVNDSLEEDALAAEKYGTEDIGNSDSLPKQINGMLQSSINSSPSDLQTRSPNGSSEIENGHVVEEYVTVGNAPHDFQGVDCGCCRYGGQTCRYIVGNTMAFLSGILFTINNFVIKACRLSFGEIIAVRSIIQIPLMTAIVLIQGHRLLPSTTYQRVMLCLIGLFGSLTMFTSFACVKFMPVADAITLMFTTPLFTMILAALFLRQRLSVLKVLSASILMAGIVLVAKPSFLFPENTIGARNGSWQMVPAPIDWRHEYQKGIFFLFDLKTPLPPGHDPADYYFVGALIALSCAIFGAAMFIVAAKLGDEVPTNVRLLYIGISSFVVAGLAEFVDDRDRIFTSNIINITAYEWGVYIGLACNGLLGFYLEFRSLTMVSPTIVSTLRTTEIVVAFVGQVLITLVVPNLIDVLGASFVFIAALVLIFESRIYEGVSKICSNRCCRPLVTATESLTGATEGIVFAQDVRHQA